MPQSFFKELKQRNVFKVGAAYLVLAWAIAQVADIVVPALGLPESIITAVLFFALIGFPFALFFAWVFEVTPEGIKKESDIRPEESGRTHSGIKLALAGVSMLVMAAGYLVFDTRIAPDSSDEARTRPTDNSDQTSIAVLPFVNMSSDPEQEYFSDGISEELLNLLAKIPNLQVAARTSSFQFKNKNQDIQDIAARLGVETILEGSIRKSGSTVRITAQLVKANDGFHMWSDTYDRELDDIFEIQDEISAAIVSSLKETLGIDLADQAPQSRRISPEAHDAYLQGLRDLYIYTFESLETAVMAFEKAIALAPDFPLAKIKLAETYQFQIQTGSRFDREILVTADEMLRQVLVSHPDAADAHYVRSLIAAKQGKRELAEDYVLAAYELNPNQANIITRYATLLGRELGEKKTRALFARAQRLDPLNFRVTYNFYSYLLRTLQKFDEAEEVLLAADKNTTDSLYPAVFASHYRRMGQLNKALHYNRISTEYDPLDPEGPLYASFIYLCLGDGAIALEKADLALELNSALGDAVVAKTDALIHLDRDQDALEIALAALDRAEYSYRRVTKANLLSNAVYALMQAGELDTAEQLIVKHYPDAVNQPYEPKEQSVDATEAAIAIELLSTVSQAQGNDDKAQSLAQSLVVLDEAFYMRGQSSLMPIEYRLLAAANAAQNNNDAALEYLESLPNGIFPIWWRSHVLQSPLFLHLHDNARFQSLGSRFESEMRRQQN